MNEKIWNTVRCLLILLIVAGILAGLTNLVRPTDTDAPVAAIRGFHRMPEDSIEVIGFGSSIMWRGLDPLVMYENYGIAAYNYGCNWQRLNTTELFIEDALSTQSPKVAVIETHLLHRILQDTDMDGQIYYTREIPHSPKKMRYLRQCFGTDPMRYLSYYFPFCAFHHNWNNLTKQSFRTPSSGESIQKHLGFMNGTKVTPVEIPDYTTFSQKAFDPEILTILERIVSVCKDRNIEILFYTSPKAAESYHLEAIETFARQHGCAYLNLYAQLEETGIDPQRDFSDSTHLNSSGAAKVADYLGNYITEHYDVSDLREIPGNFWETVRNQQS